MAGEKPGNLCLSYAGAFKVRVGKGETDEKEAGGGGGGGGGGVGWWGLGPVVASIVA